MLPLLTAEAVSSSVLLVILVLSVHFCLRVVHQRTKLCGVSERVDSCRAGLSAIAGLSCLFCQRFYPRDSMLGC